MLYKPFFIGEMLLMFIINLSIYDIYVFMYIYVMCVFIYIYIYNNVSGAFCKVYYSWNVV